MVKSVEGIYRNGKVELMDPLPEAEGSRVIVTWSHPAEPVDLREREIAEPQAAVCLSTRCGPSLILSFGPLRYCNLAPL
jgi:hypothetical protein